MFFISTSMQSFYSSLLFLSCLLISRDGESPDETKPVSPGTAHQKPLEIHDSAIHSSKISLTCFSTLFINYEVDMNWAVPCLSCSLFHPSVWGSRGKENRKGVPVHSPEATAHLVSWQNSGEKKPGALKMSLNRSSLSGHYTVSICKEDIYYHILYYIQSIKQT